MSGERDDVDLVPTKYLRFPVELRQPPQFRPEAPESWPRFPGRLEYVGGRLLWMSPSGDLQQDVCAAITAILFAWCEQHPEFIVGANEAGMMLGGDVRAADAAVWRAAEVGAQTGRYRRTAPVLAVEVSGTDESREALREKAAWYLRQGVSLVWLVSPEPRQLVVVHAGGEELHTSGALPERAELPGLRVELARVFSQLRER